MHEFSIIQSMIPQIEEFLAQGNYRKVNRILLEVGVMSGVIQDALEFAYDICSRGTPLEGAVLSIRLIPVIASCEKCFVKFEIQDYRYMCPQCGGIDLKLLSGNELTIKEIEVEEACV
jgi:hydrogenase nickel incorporation protein HypA/HybF